MSERFYARIKDELADIEAKGLRKVERLIETPQATEIEVGGKTVINFCANNYLGLADHTELVKAAKETGERYGFGMASVRFICGTLDLHRELEKRIADFFGYDDSITFAACFDANGAVFEPLLGPNDAIVSDALNHASIIDGVRLCKAKRYRYANNDMADLDKQLAQARADGAETILVVTDGVFSMDGIVCDLEGLCDTAEKYGALVMVDDCHSGGFLGKNGRGTAEHCGVEGRVHIMTGTLGKALGGGMGGYICAAQPVIDLLRQKARPYLFSNALAPSLVGAAIKAFDLVEAGDDLRTTLHENGIYFRKQMQAAGFNVPDGNHPIVPVMLGDAKLSQDMAAALMEDGIYVIGFFFPVVMPLVSLTVI